MDDIDRYNNPRWNAVYGALVAAYIQADARKRGRVPSNHELRVIVRMAKEHADDVQQAWQDNAEMEKR